MTPIYPELSNRIGIKNPENLPNLSSRALLLLAEDCFQKLKGHPLEFRKTFVWEPMVREILGFVKSAKRLTEFAEAHLQGYQAHKEKAGEGIEELLVAGTACFILYHHRAHLKDGDQFEGQAREQLKEIARLIYDPDEDWADAWKRGKPPCVKLPAICYAYLFFEAASAHDKMERISTSDAKKILMENSAFLDRYRQHLRKGP